MSSEIDVNDLSYKEQVLDIIKNLKLNSTTENSILKSRFLSEVLTYEKRKLHTKKYYNIFRFIVTSGSILLPAVLSLGQMDPAKLPKNFDNISYWISWTISLSVTASNGFLQLFSLDKNYFEYAITTEQLKTEGWQYFQLSGKYEDYKDHKEGYRPFCKSIENIKRKQVEKEFSGKGEVKKKKEFDFKKELMAVLPDKFEPNTEKNSLQERLDSDNILKLLENFSSEKTSELKKIARGNLEEVIDEVKNKKSDIEKGIDVIEQSVEVKTTGDSENSQDKK
jgi:hypothetical protein